ncbi:NADPH-dependent FMN reductase [Streptomyces cyaneofuscatus]|uniref:NADPH-dependent FMN reductase n=1 Tax=Streptomyces cyaneofuscatus TaxID=66883 RepID=UPI0036AFDA16
MDNKPKLVIIIGSVREGRFGPAVASWVAEQADTHGAFDVTVVDLADSDLPLALPDASPKYAGDAYPRPAGMAELTSALESADAFVVVTPEYNHSYPASLKAAIDWHFTQWEAKAVAFPNYFTTWQDGRPLAPEAPGYAKTLLDQLAWWATALRSARRAAPFPA